MPARRRRKPTSQAAPKVPIKEEPIEEVEPPASGSRRRGRQEEQSAASNLPVKIKVENEGSRGGRSRKKQVAPISISPPGAKQENDGSLKMKFILSPKREASEEDEESAEEEEEEEEEVPIPGPSRRGSSKQGKGLKMKISYKTSSEETPQSGGKTSKRRGAAKEVPESYVHPKKRFKTTFEESLSMSDQAPTVSSGRKGRKFDSDSGYSDTAGRSRIKQEESSPIPEPKAVVPAQVDKRTTKDKKKKRKEKDKKKKFFKNKSDKNRFLNVHRSSDEGGEGGWIEERENQQLPPPKEVAVVREESLDSNEYEVVATWTKPGDEELGEESKEVEIPLEPIRLKKDKKKSKHRHGKHRHGKKRKAINISSHVLPEKKQKDKESFTQEQIIKIQQRLMLQQGLKSPSSAGEDLGGLNFSSHGEDLISQLTASSGHFDPSSLLGDFSTEEQPDVRALKPVLIKSSGGRKNIGGRGKLATKDKQKIGMKANNRGNKRKVPTAYQMWCKANRNAILKVNPGLDFSAMSRKLGEMWMALPEKEKTTWKHKQRALLLRHKNVPALSRMKKQTVKPNSAKVRSQQYKAPPPHTDPIDVAAHLKLLGDSLLNVGQNLMTQAGGATEVHGSMSVLMDSMLTAIAPLICLTSEVPELNVLPKKQQSSLLENIAYIMPGL